MVGEWDLERTISSAVEALGRGRLVACPTDTFFALAADAMNSSAVKDVFVAKGRADGKPVPLLIAGPEHILSVATSIPVGAEALIQQYWPGPLTLVLPKRSEVPDEVSGGTESVGVRMPDHIVALRLLREFGGAITGTSANLAGGPPVKSAEEVRRSFGGRVDVYIDVACGPHRAPSTVVDFTKSPPELVRVGAISWHDLVRDVPTLRPVPETAR